MESDVGAALESDVFACGSTLGNLLRFVRGIDKTFRFNVEIIGETVFLIRKENDPKELIEGIHGFGHSFPEAYTTWPKEVRGSETHQRIVQYNLGGLQCLVRFECDGFFDNLSNGSNSHSSVQKGSATSPSQDVLAQAMSDTTISTQPNHSTDPLTIKHAGEVIPQRSIFDLKTRSGKHRKEINMDDITPQLWLKQIPNFIVAYHDGFGFFQDIQIQDTRSRLSEWEGDNTQAIRRLIILLKKIIEIAKSDKRGLLEIYCPGTDVLEIRNQFGDGLSALPAALNEAWVTRCEMGGLELDDDTGYGASPQSDRGASTDGHVDSDEDEKDFTACSAEDCGYCGRCTY